VRGGHTVTVMFEDRERKTLVTMRMVRQAGEEA
jgi:hypothetical protein